MKNQKTAIKKLESDIKTIEVFDKKFSMLLSDLYEERFLEAEREKKVLLDRFYETTQGKEIIIENSTYKLL